MSRGAKHERAVFLRHLQFTNCGGLLLGVFVTFATAQASHSAGGLCGPFPPQASWLGQVAWLALLWSAVDLMRRARAWHTISVWCGGLGLLLGILNVFVFFNMQYCRN